MRAILCSPLPRAYEEDEQGRAVPIEEPRIIGATVAVDRITQAGKDMQKRLEQEVLQPLKQWTMAFKNIQVSGHCSSCLIATRIAPLPQHIRGWLPRHAPSYCMQTP